MLKSMFHTILLLGSVAFFGTTAAVCNNSICTECADRSLVVQSFDSNLEQLAISVSKNLTAPQDVYDRLSVDVPAIQEMMRVDFPAVATIHFWPSYRGSSLLLTLEDSVLADVLVAFAGSLKNASQDISSFSLQNLSQWECMKSHYGVRAITSVGNSSARLDFYRNFNMAKLAIAYAALPEVAKAEPDFVIGGGSTIEVFRKGNIWQYAFVHAYGDCPAGCTNRDAYIYQTIAGGVPQFLQKIQSSVGALNPPANDDAANQHGLLELRISVLEIVISFVLALSLAACVWRFIMRPRSPKSTSFLYPDGNNSPTSEVQATTCTPSEVLVMTASQREVPTSTPSEVLAMTASQIGLRALSDEAVLGNVMGKPILGDDETSETIDAEAQVALGAEHVEDDEESTAGCTSGKYNVDGDSSELEEPVDADDDRESVDLEACADDELAHALPM